MIQLLDLWYIIWIMLIQISMFQFPYFWSKYWISSFTPTKNLTIHHPLFGCQVEILPQCRSQFVLHSFLSTGLLGNGFTLAVLWRSPRLYNCCTPYLISMTICDLLASLLILPLLGRVHSRFKFQVWHPN